MYASPVQCTIIFTQVVPILSMTRMSSFGICDVALVFASTVRGRTCEGALRSTQLPREVQRWSIWKVAVEKNFIKSQRRQFQGGVIR